MKENSIEEDMEILEEIIKGDEDCINAIYSQMKVKNDNDEDIQYYKKEIQSIKNIVDNYLKEKARADKLEKEYSAMLTELDENECDYKRVLKENEKYKRIAEINLKDAEEFKNNMCEHRCLLKSENEILQKENKELKESNEILNDAYWNECITKQTIKDKIEKINDESHAEELEDIMNRKNYTITELVQYVLQELLEGRK